MNDGKLRRNLAWGVLLLFAVGTLAGCGGTGGAVDGAGEQKVHAGGYPIRAVCTVGMVADLVRHVGGKHVQVTQLLGAGIDPHLYSPTSDDMKTMAAADIIFYSGLLLEGKMTASFEQIGRRLPAIAVTRGLDPAVLITPPGEGGHHDPHVWMNVELWSQCAAEVERSLIRYDPAHAADYRRNAAAFAQELAGLHEYGKRIVATIPSAQRILITSHDAFSYFGRAYGLDVQGVQGISTESEAGLKRINDLVDLLATKKLPAVFIESSVSPKTIESLVEGARRRGHEVKIGGELFSDAMGEAGTYEGTYLGMLDHNLTLVTRALGGNAPEHGWKEKLDGGK